MAPKYVVNYFNAYGAAEPIRYLLSYKQVEFTDNRIKREDWPKIKPSTPNGQLPTLEVDGKVLHQSTAICRYLGREFDLVGDNNWEAAQIDALVDSLIDLRTQFTKVTQIKNPEEKEKEKKILIGESLPTLMSRVEKQLEENNGHVVNGKLTWGDFYLAVFIDMLLEILPEEVKKASPKTLALVEKVHELPGVKVWIAKRPPNSYSLKQVLGS